MFKGAAVTTFFLGSAYGKGKGTSPCMLYGYGSYGICIDADFNSKTLSFLDRGMVYAIAHIRGGGEMGREWYEKEGKYLAKMNTFTDFCDCAEHLIKSGDAKQFNFLSRPTILSIFPCLCQPPPSLPPSPSFYS